MKQIIICYALVLLLSVFVGGILALMFGYSLWWGLLLLFPVAWSGVPLIMLRDGARSHRDFSTIFFGISFSVLVVVVVSVTLLVEMKTFWSMMFIMSLWVMMLVTMWLISFIPREPNLHKS